MVRPLAGAGIEIELHYRRGWAIEVRPLAGAGIEIVCQRRAIGVCGCSPPRGGGN